MAHALSVRGPTFVRIFADFGADPAAAAALASRLCTATNLYASVAVVGLALAVKNRYLGSDSARPGISFVALLLVLSFKAFVDEALLAPMLHLLRAVGDPTAALLRALPIS